MRQRSPIFSSALFGLTVLMVFLFVFHQKVQIPSWMVPIGRAHPLLLHLPIGGFFLAVLLYFTNRSAQSFDEQRTFRLVLDFSVLLAVLTTITGLFLSTEPEYDPVAVAFHRNTSFTFALSTYLFSLVYDKMPKVWVGLALLMQLLLLLIAGHYGGELTHGKNFLFPSKELTDTKQDTNTSIYATWIAPILTTKCASCHNAEKAKGKLVVTDSLSLKKGGKSGVVLVAGDAAASPLIQRLHLALDDEKHMPPLGKPALSDTEVNLMTLWINDGGSFVRTVTDPMTSDTLRRLCAELRKIETPEKIYTFPFADKKLIQQLNTPYRSVKALANGSPALSATYYLATNFNAEKIRELSSVKEQLVHLNLGKMPVNDTDMDLLANFSNLERLNLNQTAITNAGLLKLKALTTLEELSLAYTNISEIPPFLLQAPFHLRKIFLNQTKISQNELAKLTAKYPQVSFNAVPEDTTLLTLTPPLLENENVIFGPEEPAILSHKINGAKIKYTLDGSDPTRTQGIDYASPISLKNALDIKAIAYKPGWLDSPVETFTLFKKGILPSSCKLLTKANEQYPGSGVLTFTNEAKAPIKNLKDQNWIAFRENHFKAIFNLGQQVALKKISFCYGIQIPSYVFPPVWVKISGGPNADQLQLLKVVKLATILPKDKDLVQPNAVHIELPGKPYAFYAIEAMNLQKIPQWHAGKGEKGWLFIDEIFFYE